ncbi:MAG TPA: M13 family metallopeptidase [Acidobacteriaceae bacterium]|nr:M13 family metallopeptidase [Acidobacteriaceae bacterium]
MSKTQATSSRPSLHRIAFFAFASVLLTATALTAQPPAAPAAAAEVKPLPSFDLSSIDLAADPCVDMYKFACGHFSANHPIPSDQSHVNAFSVLYNVDTQELNAILQQSQNGGASRTPDQQKIGDYFKACMDTSLQSEGFKSLKPLFNKIAALSTTPNPRAQLADLIGQIQRVGGEDIHVFFGYGVQQDLKDSSKQIAALAQDGLGLPEKDYYIRTGEKDAKLRAQYVAHITKMLTLSGTPAAQASRDAQNILALETALAKASLGVVEMRDPEKTYHLQPIATLTSSLPGFDFTAYEDAMHSPHISEINNATPEFWPAMIHEINHADIPTIQAYLRYHLLSIVARSLSPALDDENFDFHSHILNGTPQQQPRWKRCSGAVDVALGEALGKVYVERYFAGDSKAKTLQMVHDIESAMNKDIDQLDWMSPATKVRAHEKLAAVANKIGYPDKWRDYTSLIVKPDDPLGNTLRANAFENDRQLNKIGKPVDRGEWDMTPPTVNAYYNPSMNDINFPAGILQQPFYDTTQDIAVNYGHIGAVIGHELTHGFDDEGRKFNGQGNLDNWWTSEDLKKFEARTDCLANEYSSFTAVDDVKVNGRLTLGENTADNGGVVLAFMAYLQRAKDQHVDINEKTGNFTGPQRFYIAYAQNWCENTHPEAVRSLVLTNPHAPDPIRVDGVIQNQPGFASAFGCKKPTPMVPATSCRVW